MKLKTKCRKFSVRRARHEVPEPLMQLLQAVRQNPQLPVDLAHAAQNLCLVVHQLDALCVGIVAGCERSLVGGRKVPESLISLFLHRIND